MAQEPAPAPSEESMPRLEASFEYLLWWIKDGPLPGPMVTTGNPGVPIPGALGNPDTRVLYGNDGIDYKAHSGGRLTLDYWLDNEQIIGFEAVGLILETHTFHFAKDSDKAGNPVIARPFFDVIGNQEFAQVTTAPGVSFGGIDVFSDSRLWGGEANVLGGAYR